MKTILTVLAFTFTTCYGQIPDSPYVSGGGSWSEDTIRLLNDSGWKAQAYYPYYDSVRYERIEINGKSYPMQISYRNGNVLDSLIWTDGEERKRDTVLAFCMYSDTTIRFFTTNDYHTIVDRGSDSFHFYDYKKDTTYHRDYDVHYGYFYSVRELHNTAEGISDPFFCAGCKYYDYYQHIYYLDKNKNTLSKNIIVWMAK